MERKSLRARISPKMRRWYGFAALVATLAIMTFYLGTTVANRQILMARPAATLFTLQLNVYSYSQNPAGDLTSVTTTARRSDGTTVELNSVGDPSLGIDARRITYGDGRSVSMVDAVGAKTTWPKPPDEDVLELHRLLLNPPSNCVFEGEIFEGSATVLGHPVKVVKSLRLPGKTVTEWRAPDLACYRLQYRLEAKQQDSSLILEAEGKAQSLTMGDPDAALFNDGATYAERKPSEIQHLVLEKMNIPENAGFIKMGQDMDAAILGK